MLGPIQPSRCLHRRDFALSAGPHTVQPAPAVSVLPMHLVVKSGPYKTPGPGAVARVSTCRQTPVKGAAA